jgi:hypothetical protein
MTDWREENRRHYIELWRLILLDKFRVNRKATLLEKILKITFSIEGVEERTNRVLCHDRDFVPGIAFRGKIEDIT